MTQVPGTIISCIQEILKLNLHIMSFLASIFSLIIFSVWLFFHISTVVIFSLTYFSFVDPPGFEGPPHSGLIYLFIYFFICFLVCLFVCLFICFLFVCLFSVDFQLISTLQLYFKYRHSYSPNLFSPLIILFIFTLFIFPHYYFYQVLFIFI